MAQIVGRAGTDGGEGVEKMTINPGADAPECCRAELAVGPQERIRLRLVSHHTNLPQLVELPA